MNFFLGLTIRPRKQSSRYKGFTVYPPQDVVEKSGVRGRLRVSECGQVMTFETNARMLRSVSYFHRFFL